MTRVHDKPARPTEGTILPDDIQGLDLRCPACNGPTVVIIDDDGMELVCEFCTAYRPTDRGDG